MKIEFDDLPWHDANLQSIYIDRENPGECNVVNIVIDWPDGKSSVIEFYDCYTLNVNMNFGIVTSEPILQAEYFIDSEELTTVRKKWANLLEINLGNLKHFKITTNSTNSVINILALGFKMINIKNNIILDPYEGC